ncbi:hypothetical protein RFI_25688 [Reticulomyxa filosa]|uniref:Transmembrane protein n=1 Tax=Reticulomyxa filosa TaxID=46433 RepID=X6ME26_RETFI|nr:hypothetical protein RFI_25688 [Reticulomyxa filosa]|eukprot:ETO11687.1 hypothetical protein RFI_25688 [Reticulomyxa filosa]
MFFKLGQSTLKKIEFFNVASFTLVSDEYLLGTQFVHPSLKTFLTTSTAQRVISALKNHSFIVGHTQKVAHFCLYLRNVKFCDESNIIQKQQNYLINSIQVKDTKTEQLQCQVLTTDKQTPNLRVSTTGYSPYSLAHKQSSKFCSLLFSIFFICLELETIEKVFVLFLSSLFLVSGTLTLLVLRMITAHEKKNFKDIFPCSTQVKKKDQNKNAISDMKTTNKKSRLEILFRMAY